MVRARRSVDVHGLAQGVGFRPFVHALAQRHGLGGFVLNTPHSVHIEVEGEGTALAAFEDALTREAPRAACIAEVISIETRPRGEREFTIAKSTLDTQVLPSIAQDLATCARCLDELHAADDRRFRHAFISCTQCGPRFSVLRDVPFDRARTSMDRFPLCDACAREYRDPRDRRFHAQVIACPACGPRLALHGAGASTSEAAALEAFAARLLAGGIGALKGVGGFHLVCDATNGAAVARLRSGKQREARPFAIMLRTLADAEHFAHLGALERETLASAAAPIVLVRSRANTRLAPGVAPQVDTLGLMLAYTPAHHLLLQAVGDRPLVVTSGNPHGEPIAHRDEEAFQKLDCAETFLTHDRPIELRCEDSVMRVLDGHVVPLRRARGLVPRPVALPFACERTTLAMGGDMKACFALGSGTSALLGPHAGELDRLASQTAWEELLLRFERLFRLTPRVLAHDLHPDYAATRYALERRAKDQELMLVPVQHHHAHLASCMADNGLEGEVFGVCFDGSGLGNDGTLWGGEFLLGGYQSFRRVAHFQQVELLGGDRAAREPWRVALSCLRRAGLELDCVDLKIDRRMLELAASALSSPTLTFRSSSVGRLFDAVAGLTGLLPYASYEGQAGLMLEALAREVAPCGSYPFELGSGSPRVLQTDGLVQALVRDLRAGVAPASIARRFHSTILEMVVSTLTVLRAEHGLSRVVLSGGVFANAILCDEIATALRRKEFQVFPHRQVPPNDGGLCLGQLAVAAHHRANAVFPSDPEVP